MIRFTVSNWARFETHNKQTTIRSKKVKHGVHEAGSGSCQWGNYKPYPEKVYVHSLKKSCLVKELTEDDAKSDGFDSLCELLLELGGLNKSIKADSQVFIYPVRKIIKKSEDLIK